jgi:5-methylcytosine-specific restriction endonuclease McrA
VASADYSPEFVAWVLAQKMSKRAVRARDILLERGTVTTADLNALGYDHPPRAIGDLKDAGITLVREMVTVDGRRMAQYRLLDTLGGDEAIRRQLPKKFREALYDAHDHQCAVCGGRFTARELQTDHRIPFRIAGDPDTLDTAAFMPICGSDNRAKSWTCEHCVNWTKRDPEMCRDCYWASPDDYRHIAGEPERRLVVALRGPDVRLFDHISAQAQDRGVSVGEWVVIRLREIADE